MRVPFVNAFNVSFIGFFSTRFAFDSHHAFRTIPKVSENEFNATKSFLFSFRHECKCLFFNVLQRKIFFSSPPFFEKRTTPNAPGPGGGLFFSPPPHSFPFHHTTPPPISQNAPLNLHIISLKNQKKSNPHLEFTFLQKCKI